MSIKNMFNSKIYLCVDMTSNKNKPSDFKCMKFNTFEEADKYYRENYEEHWKGKRSTMVKINPMIPSMYEMHMIRHKIQLLTLNVEVFEDLKNVKK